MTTKQQMKLVREGEYVAEVPVELILEEGGWSPYLPLEEARKIDWVRKALRAGNTREAARHARIFRLSPVAAD